jgi:hypothetical protein
MVSSSSSTERSVCGMTRGFVRDDERVAGGGLGLARVEVGDASHRQSGQVGDRAAHVPCHRQWEGADGGGLVDHDEKGAVPGLELAEERAEPGFAVGQPLVQGLLPGRGDDGGVVFALANVQAEEDSDVAGVNHTRPSLAPARPSHGTDRHIHIAKSLPTCGQAGGHAPHQRSVDASGPVTPPPRPCDQQGETVVPDPEAGRPIAGPPKKVKPRHLRTCWSDGLV